MDQETFTHITPKKRSLLTKVGDAVLLSFCFLICSLPVITLGVSCTALYFAVYKRYKEGSETPASDFFRSFRKNLRQGTVLTIFLLAYIGGAGFFLYYSLFGLNRTAPPGWCLPVAVFLMIPAFFMTMFTFPYLARFSNTVVGTIFHCFTFSMMYLGHTIFMWLIFLASIALIVVFPPLALVVPYISAFLCWKLCEPDFNYAILLQDKREHPEKYKSEQPESEEDDEEEYDEDEDPDEEDEEEDDEEYEDDPEYDAETVDEDEDEE